MSNIATVSIVVLSALSRARTRSQPYLEHLAGTTRPTPSRPGPPSPARACRRGSTRTRRASVSYTTTAPTPRPSRASPGCVQSVRSQVTGWPVPMLVPRNSVQPAVLHLRLVVQCGLLHGGGLLQSQWRDRGCSAWGWKVARQGQVVITILYNQGH